MIAFECVDTGHFNRLYFSFKLNICDHLKNVWCNNDPKLNGQFSCSWWIEATNDYTNSFARISKENKIHLLIIFLVYQFLNWNHAAFHMFADEIRYTFSNQAIAQLWSHNACKHDFPKIRVICKKSIELFFLFKKKLYKQITAMKIAWHKSCWTRYGPYCHHTSWMSVWKRERERTRVRTRPGHVSEKSWAHI